MHLEHKSLTTVLSKHGVIETDLLEPVNAFTRYGSFDTLAPKDALVQRFHAQEPHDTP